MNRNLGSLASIFFALLVLVASPATAARKANPEKQLDSLDQYLKQLAVPAPGPLTTTSGSVFSSIGLLANPYSDYKALFVGDSLTVRIVESTAISQSGDVTSQRNFTHSSGVTGVGGQTPSFLNPLLATNSSTNLTGKGAADSKSSLNSVLTAQVVAVLPSGSLVIEARRKVFANQQHENVVLRGVARPADIAANNSIYSHQLSNLQLEVKGKGVISDSVRQPNIVMRTLLKFIGF